MSENNFLLNIARMLKCNISCWKKDESKKEKDREIETKKEQSVLHTHTHITF